MSSIGSLRTFSCTIMSSQCHSWAMLEDLGDSRMRVRFVLKSILATAFVVPLGTDVSLTRMHLPSFDLIPVYCQDQVFNDT